MAARRAGCFPRRAALEVSTARARALTGAGSLAWNQGDYPAARTLLEESLSLRRRMFDAQGVADALNNLARLAFWQGDFDVTRTLYEESLGSDRHRGDDWGAANSLCGLALLAVRSGDLETAHRNLRESLTLRQSLSDTEGIIECLEVFAALASVQGRFARVVSLLAISKRARDLAETPLPPAMDFQTSEMLSAARAALSSEDYDAAWRDGQTMSVEQALGLELAEPSALER